MEEYTDEDFREDTIRKNFCVSAVDCDSRMSVFYGESEVLTDEIHHSNGSHHGSSVAADIFVAVSGKRDEHSSNLFEDVGNFYDCAACHGYDIRQKRLQLYFECCGCKSGDEPDVCDRTQGQCV